MPPNFTKSLAQRLDAISNIRVHEAEDGLPIEANAAYIAPGGYHMTIVKEGSRYCLRTSKEDPRGGHRPSVDTLFESLVPFTELKKYVVIMTGMGSDGAKGMLALKNAGAKATIAEAEETCIVYGMPRAAVELNCVDYILPQQQIADKLVFEVMK
jgi:two-component system chemotaxis response regulator CheB